jgi:polysaccharide export outer membrane protein
MPGRRSLHLAGFFFVFAVTLLAAFAQPPPAPAASGAADPAIARAVPLVDGNYRLTPQDVVKVTVFREDELTTTARIAEDGTIKMPLIGTVKVGGRSVSEAAAQIEVALEKDYLVHPQVSVSVTEFAKRRFTVMGQVQKPGAYEMPASESVDVIAAIGMAGGYTRSANVNRITVKRSAAGAERLYKLNGKQATPDGNARTFKVMAGDTITVEESFF